MSTPDLPDYYQIPRAEVGINVRPSGTQEGYGEPPFGDLFTEQIPTVLAQIRDYFVDWPAHIKATLDVGIDWLQQVVGLNLDWAKTLVHKIVDIIAPRFDVSSWTAFMDTAIASSADLVGQSFPTVFDWVASLFDGFVSFLESSCNLDLTWLHDLVTQARDWSAQHVDLTSKINFVDGVNAGGFWANLANLMLQGGAALLGIDSPLNAANLFGLIDPSSLPAIEIGRLFKGDYGLIADGGFALPPSGSVDTGEWFWDNTIGVTANGCAGIVGDGATHDLIGQPIGVRAGQPFTFDTFVRWKDASVTAGSEPLQLLVIEFADRVQVGEVVIASVATTGSLLTFQRLDGGDYTVPDGVDSICPAVRVTSDLLAGDVLSLIHI